jgi:hypothetical protein
MVDVPRVVGPKEVPWATYKLQCMHTIATYVVQRAIDPKKFQWPHTSSNA